MQDQSHAGRRGLAGMVLVCKIAGALAEQGASLGEVKKVAQETAEGKQISLSPNFHSFFGFLMFDSCSYDGCCVEAVCDSRLSYFLLLAARGYR